MELLKAHQRKGEGQGASLCKNFSKQRLERKEGRQQASDKLLPEIGPVVVHKAHILSQ
jgi:hypothetical protein